MALTDDDVREILRIIDESELDELLVETDGFSLHVSKNGTATEALRIPRRGPAADPAPAGLAPAAAEPAAPTEVDGLTTVASPMLGTFYRAESPGEPPFVEIGATVGPDTTVCIIEVMKMMNSVPAGVSGVVAEILAENAELVEYGQPLFRVTPDE
jgi:acetyl-CoA carboxylase biotin carboxyl carrier protein